MKIGIIQARPGIGDMCVFLPFIHFIANFFETKIILFTKKRTLAKNILSQDPFVQEVVYIDKKKNINLELKSILKKKKLDKIFIMHFGYKYWLLSKLANIKEVYFYGFLKKDINVSLYIKTKISEWLKLKKVNYNCKVYIKLKKFIKKNEKKIIIGIGGSGKNKKWDINNYVKLIKLINDKNKNQKYIIAGGRGEIKDFKKIKKLLPNYNLISLCGLKIDQCLEFLNNSRFYIGNDTGFMHLCGSLDIPSYGIFGDTPSNYCDYNKMITPIMPKGFKFVKQGNNALDKIYPENVFRFLSKKKILLNEK